MSARRVAMRWERLQRNKIDKKKVLWLSLKEQKSKVLLTVGR